MEPLPCLVRRPSRPLVALSGVIVLGFTVLWMVRLGQEAGALTVGGEGGGVGDGAAYAVGGGLLLLVAAVVMSGRVRSEPPETEAHTHRRLDGPPTHPTHPGDQSPPGRP